MQGCYPQLSFRKISIKCSKITKIKFDISIVFNLLLHVATFNDPERVEGVCGEVVEVLSVDSFRNKIYKLSGSLFRNRTQIILLVRTLQ